MTISKRHLRGMAILHQRRLPTLSGDRVALRGLTATDVDDIYEIYSDPEAMRFWSTAAMTAKSQARTLLREIREEHVAGRLYEWGVVLLDFALDELGLRRVEADTDPGNSASIRLLESLGFRREGLLRERWNVGGGLQDATFFGLLARGYRPRRS